MKKGILKYVLIVSCFVFLIYNIIWYFGTYKVFQEYQKSFPEVADSGVKIYVDEENYQYSVKIPSYLCWNGSMAVSEQNANHALIIWRGFGGKKELEGIILTTETGEMVQIELENSSKAVDSENQNMVDENLDLIHMLYEKANNVWGLELK